MKRFGRVARPRFEKKTKRAILLGMKHTKAPFALVALIAFLAVLAPSALAQTKGQPLTDKEVSKLVADWPAIVDWLEKKGAQIENAGDGGLSQAILADKEFKAMMAQRGWTVERFGYVSSTAFYLTSVITMEKQNPEIAKEFDDAIAQIRASELPPDQKAENIKAMEEAKAAMLGLSSAQDINQAELKIVRGQYDKLYALYMKYRNR